MILRTITFCIMVSLLTVTLASAAEQSPAEDGRIVTFWPLVDYRESPAEGFWNLAVLGPLFKLQHSGADTDVALRPLVYSRQNSENRTTDNEYLYPLASSKATPEMTRFEILKLISKDVYRE